MRAELVERAGDRATVRLVPGWIRRLFGACESLVELEWHAEGRGGSLSRGWLVEGSRRWLWETPHGRLKVQTGPGTAIAVRQ